MTGEEKISKLLAAKGYKLKEAYFEAISYGPSGREGGWYVEVVENEICEEPETATNWGDITLANDLIGAFMPYAFICYNLKDAIKMIELIPTNII